MKSFVYSAIKLHNSPSYVNMGWTCITCPEQFNYMRPEYNYHSLPDRGNQINYLLLIAAELGEI